MANEINFQEMDNNAILDIKEKGLGFELFEWLESLGIAIMVVLLLVIFVFRLAVVQGESMFPTLQDQNALLVTDFDYTPKDGDIVIVDSEGLGKFIIKRVIATEGQVVNIDMATSSVTVDGKVLEEPYIQGSTLFNENGAIAYPLTVPENTVFVMGDNRMHSTDSRSELVGCVPEENIYGKAFLRVWPLNEIVTF
jgi:signal peptidase I